MGTLPRPNWTSPLVSLVLSSTNFHGPISAALGNLTSINYLDLGQSQFTGAIPPELGNLEHLTYLDLRGNDLNGSMDFEMFAKLKNLEYLFLPSGGPNVLLQSDGDCSFPRIKEVGLRDCNLTKFPYFLRSSTNLRRLDLSMNMIGGLIPEWLWKVGMNTLTDLDLSYNNFTGGITSSICEASSIVQLVLSNNRLNGSIPGCLGNLSDLFFLRLDKNMLQGPLPQSLANCTSLVHLNVSYNGIYDTFPRWLNSTYGLSILDLQSNRFRGAIEVPIPPQLSYLSLSKNDFSGQLPMIFSLNSSVEFVDLADNSFDGSLPVPPLTVWYYSISSNEFSGEIPDRICTATGLNAIDLSNNSLTGFIPHCFKNKLVGHIPEIFSSMNMIRTIRLSQNQLGGTLPRSLRYCKSLEVLDLSENELEGSFADWLEALPNLQVLVLRSNKFHGPVGNSSSTGHPFPKLRIFDLSNNQFYGPLPAKYIAKLKAMRNYKRSRVQYMGDEDSDILKGYYQDSIVVAMKGVEYELVRILTLLTTIDFSRNFFEGKIPEVIGNLKALKGLNFSHNNLSGNIPSMGNLTNLEWLDLSSNKLGGVIPRGLADLTMLSWLNFSDNQLVGPIPQSTQFDTFNNSFDGNPGLCGHPLPKSCGTDASQTDSSVSKEKEEKESGSWVEWRAIPMGFACGLAFGISVWYIVLETRRPRWLARMVDMKLLSKRSRAKKNVGPTHHARRNTRGR